MEALLFGLLSWIVANSTYAMPSALPAIKYRTQAEMQIMHFCGDEAVCDVKTLPSVKNIRIAAIYNSEKREMYLPHGFDFQAPLDQATLVHELVHHLQALAGKFADVSCSGPLEYEAYRIEDRWLAAQGLPVPEKTFARIMAESCNPGPT